MMISSKLRSGQDMLGGRVLFWFCPGCQEMHHVPLDNPMRPGEANCGPWSWNGNAELPSFSPSVNVRPNGWDVLDPHAALGRCHSIITDGNIAFCSDCQHVLVGQTVPMPDLPPWHLDSTDERYRAWLKQAYPDTWDSCFGPGAETPE